MIPFLPADVSPEVAVRQVRRYREMSPAEKLALSDGLWDLALELAKAGVLMRAPELDEASALRRARELLRHASD